MDKGVIILGGGIAGLSLAYSLKRAFGNRIALTLLEKEGRCGGWMRTIEKDGFLFELGPHSLRITPGWGAQSLAAEVGLSHEMIEADPAAKRRLLCRGGRLERVPNLPEMLLKWSYWPHLLAAIRERGVAPSGLEDESVGAFFRRRFGDKIADLFVDPFVSGIFAGKMEELSMRSCFPRLSQMEEEAGSLIKGMLARRKKSSPKEALPLSFRGGLQRLPERLGERLGASLRLSSGVDSLDYEGGRWRVGVGAGSYEADHLVSALPAYALSPLLHHLSPKLADLVGGISYASVASVSLGFKRDVLMSRGFGYLVPSKEREAILATIFDSQIFPAQNQREGECRLTVLLGGARSPEQLSLSDQELANVALEAIERHLGIGLTPDSLHLFRAMRAIPQYRVGHGRRLRAIEEEVARLGLPLTLHGAAFYSASVNELIRRGGWPEVFLSDRGGALDPGALYALANKEGEGGLL